MKLDLKKKKLREINNTLQNLDIKKNERDFTIINPEGSHALCAGLNQEMKVLIKGHVGYYCAGMNQKAHITIDGNVGTGVAENMMSGIVHVKGNASQSAGATAHGGLLVIDGPPPVGSSYKWVTSEKSSQSVSDPSCGTSRSAVFLCHGSRRETIQRAHCARCMVSIHSWIGQGVLAGEGSYVGEVAAASPNRRMVASCARGQRLERLRRAGQRQSSLG